MALLTPLTADDAARVAQAYDLGAVSHVEPIAAGSVNSNFILTTPAGRYFCRLYEEQDARGVAFEWRLLDHLGARGVAVPARVKGPPPGALTVMSKPVGLFEVIAGRELCFREVGEVHLRAVGEGLARVHLASEGFSIEGRDRFDRDALRQRLDGVSLAAHPELQAPVARLRSVLSRAPAEGLAQGIVHGDLFRDNVRWAGDAMLAILDWESASLGAFAYDLAVVMLAWCFHDAMRWDLAAALVGAYHRVRPLSDAERLGFEAVAAQACARFATTRITDFYLRGGPGAAGYRDFRRFLARLDVVEGFAPGELIARLLRDDAQKP